MKDYFYLTQREKRAIISLLILIGILGVFCIASRKSKPSEPVPDKELTASFDSFRASLKSAPLPYPWKMEPGETIELNSADTSALKTIPGIGSGYAQRIVKYRESLGGFVSKKQIGEVWGIDNSLYEQIEPYLEVEPKISRIKINSAGFNRLNAHPYLSSRQAKVIVDIRTRKGKIQSINRLSLLDEFTGKDIKRLSPYISFE